MRKTITAVFLCILCFACKQEPTLYEKEQQLKKTLATMREALDHYKADTGKYPVSLSELVPKYLEEIPKDPITGRNDLWVQIPEEMESLSDTEKPGVWDVRSSAEGQSSSGVPYKAF